MVYVIVDSEKAVSTLLVKADTLELFEGTLKLKETQRVVGSFTDSEMQVLNSSKFAVVSA